MNVAELLERSIDFLTRLSQGNIRCPFFSSLDVKENAILLAADLGETS